MIKKESFLTVYPLHTEIPLFSLLSILSGLTHLYLDSPQGPLVGLKSNRFIDDIRDVNFL